MICIEKVIVTRIVCACAIRYPADDRASTTGMFVIAKDALIDPDSIAVDFALINLCCAGDIVVTQDYGLAAMALGKQAYAVHHSGLQR